MDTFLNLTEKEFDAILDCIQVVQNRMAHVGGYEGLGWHEQEYRAFQRMRKKVNDRNIVGCAIKIQGA